jgi:hypothetical protein
MSVLLTTPADVERWPQGTPEEALERQKPDGALRPHGPKRAHISLAGRPSQAS